MKFLQVFQLSLVATLALVEPSTSQPAPAPQPAVIVQDAQAQRARFDSLVSSRWDAEYALREARNGVSQEALGEPSPTSMAEYESALREVERLDRKLVNQYVMHGFVLPDFSAGKFLVEAESDPTYFGRAHEGISAIRAELAVRIAVNLPDLELNHKSMGGPK